MELDREPPRIGREAWRERREAWEAIVELVQRMANRGQAYRAAVERVRSLADLMNGLLNLWAAVALAALVSAVLTIGLSDVTLAIILVTVVAFAPTACSRSRGPVDSRAAGRRRTLRAGRAPAPRAHAGRRPAGRARGRREGDGVKARSARRPDPRGSDCLAPRHWERGNLGREVLDVVRSRCSCATIRHVQRGVGSIHRGPSAHEVRQPSDRGEQPLEGIRR